MQLERARQKKLEKKRKRREKKRQALRLRAVPFVAGTEVVLPFANKMSDTLIDFARPLVDRLPADPPEDDLKLVLTFASLVWNCVLKGVDVRALVLPSAQTVLEVLGFGIDEGGAVVDMLVRRKRETFAADERLIVDVLVLRDGGDLRIFAASAWS